MTIDKISTVLDDIRNARPFVLIDSSNPAGAASLILPAQYVTPAVVAEHDSAGRSVLALAMTRHRAEELGLGETSYDLPPLHGNGTATCSTPIAKARAVAAAVNPSGSASDFAAVDGVRPVIVHDGGVLVRPGHAEAAIDLVRLAGLMPSAAIWTLMGDGLGELAEAFGNEWTSEAGLDGLRVADLSDLIRYRRTEERLVECVVRAPFDCHYAEDFQIAVFRDCIYGGEHIALIRGKIDANSTTLVRIHQLEITADLLHVTSAYPGYLPYTLQTLAAYDGPAVGIFLQDSDPVSVSSLIEGGRRAYADQKCDRDYGIAAQILQAIGLGKIALLTSSRRKMNAMKGFGLEVVERIPMAREGQERFVIT